ncbi:hypothetical protein BKH43_02545 [Helicobacter sp. 13S00401-1]|uniref:hypothetical protein n=1 Tax=Helicobacter sp. 13S00401-1 TaxID=1905758 RepID=UPI000BA7BCC1|nr:hypothetical protein [Helicobacter sp. 13S00401-1]PAF51104.1 hypothetical protein BKH43_02545 [Helicobacter sp. 13S00401-1]
MKTLSYINTFGLCASALILIACSKAKVGNDDYDKYFQKYTKTISITEWERMQVTPLNNSYKIQFSNINTIKTQNCTLYSQGILLNESTAKGSSGLLLRPNKAKDMTIVIKQLKKGIDVKISNMPKFIDICGDIHANASGVYDLSD